MFSHEWPLNDFITSCWCGYFSRKYGIYSYLEDSTCHKTIIGKYGFDGWTIDCQTEQGFLTSYWVCLLSRLCSSYSYLANLYLYYLLVYSPTQSWAQANSANLPRYCWLWTPVGTYVYWTHYDWGFLTWIRVGSSFIWDLHMYDRLRADSSMRNISKHFTPYLQE